MENEEKPANLEENLEMVNYIMLSRIYDVLVLIANKMVGSEDTAKLVSYHDKGYLIGPIPSYTPQEDGDQ